MSFRPRSPARRSFFVATSLLLRCRSAPLRAGFVVALLSLQLVAGADLQGWPLAKIWSSEKKNLSFGRSIQFVKPKVKLHYGNLFWHFGKKTWFRG